MKKILLDTNFLLMPAELGVDIFSEIGRIVNFNYELYVIDKTVDELKNMIKKIGSKKGIYAKVALKMIEQKDVKVLTTGKNGNVDDLILKTAKNGFIVATQDYELKKNLKSEKIPIIALRQKKYLFFETFI